MTAEGWIGAIAVGAVLGLSAPPPGWWVRQWRRVVAWWNEADDIYAYLAFMERAKVPPASVPMPSAAACERQIAILREIGASPRSIQIAEEVLAEVRAKELNA